MDLAIAAIVVIKLGGFDGYTSEFKVKGVKKQKIHIADQKKTPRKLDRRPDVLNQLTIV